LPLANVKSIGDGFLDGVPRNISAIFLGANNTVLFDAVVKWIGGSIIKPHPMPQNNGEKK
jgi:hypothetical protein